MLMYCKKCGRVWIKFGTEKDDCDICGSICYPVPDKYLLVWNGEIYHDTIDKNKKDQFIEECVKSSPEFDEYLFNNQDRIKAQKSAEYERDMAIGDAIRQGADVKTAFRNGGQNMPKCPTCGSLNVRHISGGERVASVGFFGIFSKKINKTFKCGNCGYTW